MSFYYYLNKQVIASLYYTAADNSYSVYNAHFADSTKYLAAF